MSGFKYAMFSGPHPSLVVECPTCGAPAGHYCNAPAEGEPSDRPCDERRSLAARERGETIPGTPEQRLELACRLWERRLGLSSEAILRTLIQGSGTLVGDPGWMSHGRPYDWGDLAGNWAKEQAAAIIRESIELVYASYPRDDERTAAYAYIDAALAEAAS